MKINPSKTYNQVNKTYSNDSVKESGKPLLPKQGEIIKGEIIDLQHNNLKIRLTNGQVIEAKMTEAFEFFIGQKLEFLVKESEVDQIILKPLLEQTNLSQNKLIQILENAGITINQHNLDVVAKLLENHMPVDKDTLLKVIPFTKQFNTSIENILFLVKNNIPVTKDHVEQLVKLLENNNKLIQNLASISDDLSLLLTDQKGYELAKTLLQDNPEHQKILDLLRQQVVNITGQETSLNKGESIPSLGVPNSIEITNANDKPNPNSNITQNNTLEGEHSNLNQTQLKEDTSLQNDASKITQSDHGLIKNTLNTKLTLNELLSQNQIENLNNEILKLAKDELNQVKFSLNNKTVDELLTELNNLEISVQLKEKISHIIASRITYSILNKALFANEKQLESPKQLEAFYDKLYEKVVKLLDLSQSSISEKLSNLTKDAHQVKSAIEFMGDLNQRFNYIQLPMVFGDRLLHSELYVLNDKSKKKSDKGSLTALVRLDMVNLGHLDIYVSKTDKNVMIQFYTESDEKNPLIENKLYLLYNQLNKLGFKVQGISVQKKEKDFKVEEDFFGKEEIHEVKRYTFDMRA